MHSIRSKIWCVTVIAVLISVFVIGGVSIYFIKSEGDQSSLKEMTLLCDNQRQALNRYMLSIEQSVDMISFHALEALDEAQLEAGSVLGLTGDGRGLEGRAWDDPRQAALDAYLAAYLESVDDIYRSVGNHTWGALAYYFRLNPEISQAHPGFFYTKNSAGDFSSHPTTDIFSYAPDDIEQVGWYTLPLRQGKPTWVAPYYNANLGQKIVSYVSPLYTAGTFIGVIGMDISFQTLVDQIKDLQLYSTGCACLIDGQNRLAFHPRLESDQPIDALFPELAGLSSWLAQKGNDPAMRDYSLNGVEKKAVFAALENGLWLAIAAPASEINASWRRMTHLVLITGFSVLAFASACVIMIMARITQPLKMLTDASNRVAQGDFDVKLSYAKNDEIGQLTATFQQLTQHLKTYIDDLNSKAYKDALTNVKNKGAFDVFARNLNLQIQNSAGEKPPEFAIAMFDCNDLKSVNDQYGHSKGDVYLRTNALHICRVFSHSPVFRLGGDEFAAILINDDFQNRSWLLRDFDARAAAANKRARRSWEKVNIAKGIAMYYPGRDANVNAVLRRADAAMYRDKQQQKKDRAT